MALKKEEKKKVEEEEIDPNVINLKPLF